MKIWLRVDALPPDIMDGDDCFVGTLISADTDISPAWGDTPTMIEVGAAGGSGLAQVTSILVPAGLNASSDILDSVAQPFKTVYLTVNGLGEAALANSLDKVQGLDVVLLYEADAVSDQTYLEHMAWLSSRHLPFAIRSGNSERLRIASAFNPEALIIETELSIPLGTLWGISSLCQKGACRPLSGEEVDAGLDTELSLTVCRDLDVGSTISSADLVIAKTGERGLSPHLAIKVVDRCLRYSIRSGEPLTFGHFA